PLPPPPASSPDASAVATGVTTPSKPYIPKDDPSTPAVVISDAALAGSSQAATEKARTAQTIPGQMRSAPTAAPAPIAVASSPVSSSLDDTFRPARRSGSKLPLLLGGAALVAVAAIAVMKLGGGDAKPASDASPSSTAAMPAAEHTSQPPTPTEPPPAATPVAPAAAEVAPAASEQPEVKAPEPEPAAPIKRGKPAKKAAPTPAPRKVAARPETKSVSTPAPATEPAPAATPKPAKGVIVRETPF
ncbi:MAG: hypothetical protein ABUL60_03475, partial [Myxococcales bacterium]